MIDHEVLEAHQILQHEEGTWTDSSKPRPWMLVMRLSGAFGIPLVEEKSRRPYWSVYLIMFIGTVLLSRMLAEEPDALKAAEAAVKSEELKAWKESWAEQNK